MGKVDEEAHCCKIEESSIINIILTSDIPTYSSSHIVNCADKYELQIDENICTTAQAHSFIKNMFFVKILLKAFCLKMNERISKFEVTTLE